MPASQPTVIQDLFANVPAQCREEIFETLLHHDFIRIERIVSMGHASPEDFWFDQDQHEWVLVLQGAARLQIAGQDKLIELGPGQAVNIPARVRHRVEWTMPNGPTLWLAIHYGS